MPKLINQGTDKEGKAFDNPGYDNALKESGWTPEEAKNYWNDPNNYDPYAKAGQDISSAVDAQAPKVAIEDGTISISAPQAVLDSPLVSQIQTQLQTLKGADLSNPEVSEAINALNDEVKKSLNDWMIEETFGWTPEEFADYQRTIQIVNTTNPMNSKETIKAKRPGADFYYDDETGKVAEKTPKEWIDYWRNIYNTKQRIDMFLKSLESDDPYERVMALIMSKGTQNPIYGFDTGERIQKGFQTAGEAMSLFPKGLTRLVGTSSDVKRVEDLSKDKKLDLRTLLNNMGKPTWTESETAFEKMKDGVRGKEWKELSDAQKLFVIELGVAKENSPIRDTDRDLRIGNQSQLSKDLDYLDAAARYASKDAINNVLEGSQFDKASQIDNDLWKWHAWDEINVYEPQEEMAKDAIWANTEQNIGNFAGTIGRFLWENAVGKALTGYSMNKISDTLGEKIVQGLSKLGISPASGLGQGAIRFMANLAGTIPEDLIQMSVDNIVTYNADENKNLFNLDQMSENFKNNLIFMAGFNAVMAGVSSVKRAKMLKQVAKMNDLDTKINAEGLLGDGYEAARIVRNGGHVEFSNGKVYGVDADGKRVALNNINVEQATLLNKIIAEGAGETARSADAPGGTRQAELNATKFNNVAENIRKNADEAGGVVDDAAKATDNVDNPTVKVEVDGPNGRATEEVSEVNIRSWDDIDGPAVKVEATPAGVTHWHSRALNWIMSKLRTNLQEFHNRFGDVRASDFDWIWYNTKKGLTPDKIVGTTDPMTGRVVTQNMIDAAKWWGEQDFTKRLRMGSLKAMGNTEDYNVLGYLPHTSYDPSAQTLEEAMSGMLWQKATGKSVMKDGEYVGYGGTLAGRYRTFASNMLWDMRSKEVAAAKLIEEAQMEGKKLSPGEAIKMVEGGRSIVNRVNETSSSKDFAKGELANGDSGLEYFKKATEAVEKEGPTSGLGRSFNKNYAEMFFGAGQSNVTSQPKIKGSVALDDQSNVMRKIIIGNGMDMYSWGGADLVYSYQNAIEFVNRVMRDGLDWREELINFVTYHSHRSRQYAEAVADRMIERMARDAKGDFTKEVAIQSLSKSFRSEAWSRLRKWLVSANYDQFNEKTQGFIDDFLFRHMQLDSLINNQKIATKIINTLTELRYDALFYWNFKNSLLQVSEVNRLFTVFRFEDVAGMLRRLATDADFRAKVDMYVEAVAPRTSYLDAEVYGKYANVADAMEIGENGVKFGKLKDAKNTVDRIALSPIQTAESIKNRTMVAALVQEADRLEKAGKISGGNEKLSYIRRRFERVALAQNEMGKIGLSTNPIAKAMLFLQNFQIRELGMHYYNLINPDDLLEGTRLANGSWKNSAKYLTKVFGSKLATTLILARFGYSAAQTLGFDPFGIADGYNRLDEDEMTALDKQISNGFLTPFVAGGITSLFSDMYFMARDAYEKEHKQTIADDAEAGLNRGIFGGLGVPESIKNGSFWGDLVADFTPGTVIANRIGQMNEMLDKGWSTSAKGNKMYTAPEDAINTILGYLFGRSATQNALQYNQNYGKDLGQTISRTLGKTLANMFGGGYNQFDPIDTKNYSDWFDGSDNDLQQFEKGRRWFISERDRILDEYQDVLQNGPNYGDVYETEAKNDMNRRLDDLFEKLERFVSAYEKKNGTISGKMVKDLINVLNTEKKSTNDNTSDTKERDQIEYSKAKERYAQLGLPAVGYYSGPSKDYPGTSTDESKKEVKYEGSPQWQVSSNARWNINTEAAQVLAAGDAMLKDLRDEMKDLYSKAAQTKDYTEFNNRQGEYLEAFDNVVGPIIATYGRGVLNSAVVKDQLEKMLSTSTYSEKNNLIPYDQYGRDKYGRRRSMPTESVDVRKWAQERYSSNVFKKPTIRSSSTTQDDLDAIRRLANNGQTGMAMARALTLKVRIDNQRRSISKDDYQWLLDFLNNGGNK